MNTNFFEKYAGFNPKTMTLRTEFFAGLTTFMTMCYILAVNPSILCVTGMDKGAVFTATALVSAVGTLIMAFYARLPIALAPGMGINAFFAFTIVLGMGYSWQSALTAVFLEGIIFIIISVTGVREKIVDCIPKNLRFAISAGIGLFIAFLGFQNSGLIKADPTTMLAIGDFNLITVLSVISIILGAVLMKLKIRGGLFISILICTIVGIPMGLTTIASDFTPITLPQSLSPTFFQFDFASVLNPDMILIVLLLAFMNIFDTFGTLVATASQAGYINAKGEIYRIKQSLLGDAVATTLGAVLGTSTVCTYVESTSGIAEGGRSGVTALVVAVLFLLALFISPIFLLVPGAATVGPLVIVGALMAKDINKISFDEIDEALPAFITLLGITITYSIAEGIAFGLISYALIKLFIGKARQLTPTICILSVLLLLRYIVKFL
ncbi:MAG: NCS2 family permease [Ignavibacteria bacterium]|jgi:AGZA family xanthine/uracil permease-like MFS transporter|nr:NCS2 family permease [Ignavibacteria bacterium]